MTKEHILLLRKLKQKFETNNKYIGLIIYGSLATGEALLDSDLNFYLVATKDEFKKLSNKDELIIRNTGDFRYEKIKMDGKIICLDFLKELSVSSNEPLRESFRNACIIFDHSNEIRTLINNLLIFPENEQKDKVNYFISKLKLKQYHHQNEECFRDIYLKHKYVVELVYYASRLILSLNNLFYPGRKLLFKSLGSAIIIPMNFIESTNELLKYPTYRKYSEYLETIHCFIKAISKCIHKAA